MSSKPRAVKSMSSASMFTCSQCGAPFYLNAQQCHHDSHVRYTCGSCGKTTDVDNDSGFPIAKIDAYVHSMIVKAAIGLGIAICLPVVACAIYIIAI